MDKAITTPERIMLNELRQRFFAGAQNDSLHKNYSLCENDGLRNNDSLRKHVYQYQKISGLYVIKRLYGN